MASSISSVSLIPFSAAASRAVALRPTEAGLPVPSAPGLDTEALRRGQGFLGAPEAPSDRTRAQGDNGQRPDNRQNEPRSTGDRTALADSAPFLTQLLAQDQPGQGPRPSPADVARAYNRFREEPRTGFVLDLPERVDVTV